MNIILIGPPGSGKGTQAERICEKYNLKYISTGNLIREEIANRSPIGIRAKALIDGGHFLDDQTVLTMVKNILEKTKTGVLFDGFPRTLTQAFALEQMVPVTTVIDIEVDEAEVVKRISSRWMVDLNHEQHTFANKELASAYVKKHGGRMFQRDDDKEHVVKERLRVYHKQTEPLISYYGKKHLIYTVNGQKSINIVWYDIIKILNRKKRKH